MSTLRVASLALLASLVSTAQAQQVPQVPQAHRPTLVIVNAEIADGSGAPLRKANVRIAGERIVEIGAFKPARDEAIVDASGLVLAPGFIDIHNHSNDGLATEPLAPTQIAQGITTLVMGADGNSPWPIGAWLDAKRATPPAPNVALLVGHARVRKQVLGDDYKRTATGPEVAHMAELIARGMQEGALGMSSGLEYEVASYSGIDEVIAMARVAGERGGFYMTHVRDEADKAFEALEEEIAIAEAARIPVQHSHIKLATVGVWGKAPQYIDIIKKARARGVDFLADCYPYDAWYSTIKVLVPNKQYEDPASVERALADVGGASHVTIATFEPNPSYENRTIEQLAQASGVAPVEMYIRIIREGTAANTEARVIGQSMIESDIEAFMREPWVMVSSDGGLGQAHPRGAGTFPRVLGRYVREKKWLTLPEAVRKMSALPAQRLGWTDRGTIRVGAYADLVLFNPKTVLDRATFTAPNEPPVGIEKVFVNGTAVWSDGKPTGARPGRVLY